MLNEAEFSSWLYEFNIGKEAEQIIRRIRSSPPSRLVGNDGSNVSGRYPSRKMGQTIQFESHKVELAFIRKYEFDENVLEYYDQPGPIKISYQSVNGRHVSTFTTPDFFVMRSDGTAGWEECKPAQALEKLAEKSDRFCRNDQGTWCCPSGEEYAAKFGLSFKVRSSADINWIWQRNIEYLTDYLHANEHMSVNPAAAAFIMTHVKCKQGILLSELLANTSRITPDDVFLLIARNELYVDIYNHALCEHERTPIFTDKEHAGNCNSPPTPYIRSSAITVEPGQTITWDGNLFEIVNISSARVWLKNDNGDITSLDLTKIEELVRAGLVKGMEETKAVRDKFLELLSEKSPADFVAANKRYARIQHYLSDSSSDCPKLSTDYKWLKRYREAELRYGNGFIGLFDNISKRGNRLPKLPAESWELLKISIDEHFMIKEQPTALSAHGHYSNRCEQAGITAASYKTVTTYLKSLDPEETENRRKGPRAAYQLSTFYWELELTTPRHGDRPFEIAHLDHTELDLELVDSATGENFGKPWLTLMIDAYSRRILAFHLSYEHPSYRSCMMVLRECVRRHNRLPQNIVVDGGSDFISIYFEQLIAFHNVIKKTRPGAKPRFGSVLERLFGVTNTQFIYSLAGNTQITKNVRQATKSVSPARLAVWTFTLLTEKLGQYFSEAYDTLDHPALGESPRDAFSKGMVRHGNRPFRLIPYDEAFILSSLPSTPKGYAKIIPSRGIKINNIYYWHEAFRANSGVRSTVRYDPYDIGTAYAYVGKCWLTCRSQYYAQLTGLTEFELRAISTEITQRQHHSNKKTYINAQKIAAFIAEVKGTESTLKAQKKAAEMKTKNPLSDGPVYENLPAATRVSATEIYDTL